MSAFFLCAIFQLVDATCSIVGATCKATDKVSGICVPLDSKGESQDCRNVYGFFAGGTICQDTYGSDYANVDSLNKGRLTDNESRCCVSIPCTGNDGTNADRCAPVSQKVYCNNYPGGIVGGECTLALEGCPSSGKLANQKGTTCLDLDCWNIPKCK
jgi:hypothetical protein